MLKELQQLDTIISSIHTLAENNNKPPFSTDDQLSFSAILQALHDCKSEFESLRDLVEKFKPNQQLGAKKHLANKVKWILEEKKITKSCQKLERLKLSLTTVLTSVGWQNSVKIQYQLKFDREHILKNQKAAALQNQALHDDIKYAMTDLQTSSTQAQSSLNNLQVSTSTGISNLQDIVQTTQINTISVQRQIQEAQVTVSTGQNEIRSEIVQGSSNTSKALRIISKDMKQNRKLQIQSHKSLNNFIRKEINRLLTQLTSMELTSDDPDSRDSTTNLIDLETITMPLMLMKTHLSNTLTILAQDPQIEITKEDVDMLLSEFNKLLAASHAASVDMLKQDPSQISSDTTNSARAPSATGTAASDSIPHSTKRRHTQEICHSVKRRRPLIREDTDTGCLAIGIHNERNTESQIQSKVFGALFMPLRRICQIGVYLEFKKIMSPANHPVISRYMRPFRVISYFSAAFKAAMDNDVSKLQNLFSAREASPWDRTEEGNVLIIEAAGRGAEESCRLLMQEGATLHDYHWGKHNVLWSIWCGYLKQLELGCSAYKYFNPPIHLNYWINLSDFFIRRGALVEDCHEPLDNRATLLHLPPGFGSISITTLTELCQYFLRIGCDMEAQNSYGETAFLYAAMSSRQSNSAAWLQILIDNGANVAATDNNACNALHLAVTPINILMESGFYELFKPEVLESKLNVLLQAGCDPNSVNCYGETPSDIARGSKGSKIWKSALEKAGIDSKGFDDKHLYDDSDKTDDDDDTASNSDYDRVDDDDSASQDFDSDGGVPLDDH